MSVLKALKKAVSRYFPLHFNATVVALKDELEEATFVCYSQRLLAARNATNLQMVLDCNAAYLRDNMRLRSILRSQKKESNV